MTRWCSTTGWRCGATSGLEPDRAYELDGVSTRTLPRPPGELLTTFATVNDVHFGEVECGIIEGLPSGPTFRAAEGDDPYPVVMNHGAITEIQALDPAAVVVKGDLTSEGTVEEYAAFLDAYGVFGERLHHVRGNHDAFHGGVRVRPRRSRSTCPACAWP